MAPKKAKRTKEVFDVEPDNARKRKADDKGRLAHLLSHHQTHQIHEHYYNFDL